MQFHLEHSVSDTNYATLLHDNVWVVLCWEWPWLLLRGFVMLRTVLHVITSVGFMVCYCDWEFLQLPSQLPHLPPCSILFFPLIRKLLMGCGFESTDTISAVIMESIHWSGWPQGCLWSYIMLMGVAQGTFSELCGMVGLSGCVLLCGSCRLNKFVRHFNPVQETWNWFYFAVCMDYVICNISYSFFCLSLRNWN